MRHPRCRDLYLGLRERHQRRAQRLPDAHLTDREIVGPVRARADLGRQHVVSRFGCRVVLTTA